MRMLTLMLILLFCACRERKPVVAEPRPVKVTTAAVATTIDRDFAGMATPDDAVNLAFKLSGQVLDVPVSQGQSVRRGDLIAELDTREVELRVAADRSTYEEAQSQNERMQRLLAHEAVSRQQAEAAATRLSQARSTYENSLEELNQTRIRAPFDGVVERTYVDNFERVQAGETVVRLVAPETTTVKFTLSESLLSALSLPTTSFSVRFDNYGNQIFPARLKNYARTSSDASGFPVSLRLIDVDTVRYKISPGMSCTITMRMSDPVADAVSLPLSAIYAPAEGGTYVWIVPASLEVKRRKIVTGQLYAADRILIDSGVKAGERVVTAGVYRLKEGERVVIIDPQP